MPDVSKSQRRLMAGVAHDPAFAKKVGIKQSVGRKFIDADKGSDLSKLPERVVHKAKGGSVKAAKAFRW